MTTVDLLWTNISSFSLYTEIMKNNPICMGLRNSQGWMSDCLVTTGRILGHTRRVASLALPMFILTLILV